jgi:hypothetical protein
MESYSLWFLPIFEKSIVLLGSSKSCQNYTASFEVVKTWLSAAPEVVVLGESLSITTLPADSSSVENASAAISAAGDVASLSQQVSSLSVCTDLQHELLMERSASGGLVSCCNVSLFVKLADYLEDSIRFWKPLEGSNPSDELEEAHILKFLAQAQDCTFETLFAAASALQVQVQQLLRQINSSGKSTDVIKARDAAMGVAVGLAQMFVKDFGDGDLKQRYGLAFFNNTRKQKVILVINTRNGLLKPCIT